MIMKTEKGKIQWTNGIIFPMPISVKLPFFAFSLSCFQKYFCYKFILIFIPFDKLLHKKEREYFFVKTQLLMLNYLLSDLVLTYINLENASHY